MSRKVTLKELEMEYNFASDVMKEILNDFSFDNLRRCNSYLNVEINSSSVSEFKENDFNELSLSNGSVEMIRVETAHVYLYAFYDSEYKFDRSSVLLSDVYGNDLPDENGLEVVNEEYLSKYFMDENDEMKLDKYYTQRNR